MYLVCTNNIIHGILPLITLSLFPEPSQLQPRDKMATFKEWGQKGNGKLEWGENYQESMCNALYNLAF